MTRRGGCRWRGRIVNAVLSFQNAVITDARSYLRVDCPTDAFHRTLAGGWRCVSRQELQSRFACTVASPSSSYRVIICNSKRDCGIFCDRAVTERSFASILNRVEDWNISIWNILRSRFQLVERAALIYHRMGWAEEIQVGGRFGGFKLRLSDLRVPRAIEFLRSRECLLSKLTVAGANEL